jgi:pimeloyl-ACP methyl ester carboxylesterase
MLNYKVHGNGSTCLVLLHGFCENNTCFDEQVLLFKDHCKVLVPDLPGFGKSGVEPNITMAAMAREVKHLLDALQIETCVMLGHSMGGYVSLEFAHQFPQKLKGLGLIHSTALADSEERKAKRDQVVEFIRSHGKEAYVKNFIPGLFKESNRQEAYVAKAIQEAIAGPEEGIITAALGMKERLAHRALLVQTELPVFFGIGAYDELIPKEAMLNLASLCQQAEICLLENSGHMAMQEEPVVLAKAVLKYLSNFKLL